MSGGDDVKNMIYLIQGSDTAKIRHKYDAVIDSLLARKLDSLAWKIDSENFAEEKIRELIVSQDLFVHKYIVGCDHLIGDKKSQEFMLDNLAEIKKSENVFIILEDALEAKILTQVKKYTEKDLSYDRKLAEEKRFNIFAVTDALGERNRKKLWVLYQEALRAGIEDEELFWKFQWLVKHMLFFKKSNEPSQSELKGFARSKVERYARNYQTEELENLSKQLVDLFHAVRRSEGEMETGLEKLIFGV